eukprot:COSAG05_NODE_24601_length_243_cov_61.687500_1_plen_59_part_10
MVLHEYSVEQTTGTQLRAQHLGETRLLQLLGKTRLLRSIGTGCGKIRNGAVHSMRPIAC